MRNDVWKCRKSLIVYDGGALRTNQLKANGAAFCYYILNVEHKILTFDHRFPVKSLYNKHINKCM